MPFDPRTPGEAPGFDLDAAWELHPLVAVRPEPFGGSPYHFGATRRLSFLKDRAGPPTAIVELGGAPTARSACSAAAGDAPGP